MNVDTPDERRVVLQHLINTTAPDDVRRLPWPDRAVEFLAHQRRMVDVMLQGLRFNIAIGEQVLADSGRLN